MTVNISAERIVDVAPATMPASRVLGAYLTEARYESVRLLREPAFVIAFVVLPVALYLLFGVYMSTAPSNPGRAAYWFVSWAVFGMMGPGMFGFGFTVAIERQEGMLTLKRALPMPPAAYLFGKMCMAVMFGVIVMIVMIIAARVIGHVQLTAGQVVSVAVIDVAGSLPFCAIGLYVGMRATGGSAPGLLNLIYIAMMTLSGLFFPVPAPIRGFAMVSPAFHLHQLSLGAAGLSSTGAPLTHVSVLAAWTLLLTAMAVRRLVRVG